MDALLTLQRVTFALDKTFEGLISMDDVRQTNTTEIRSHWLSRALAAYCITALADADPQTAAESITDGYGDQGLDAIYFSNTEDSLYLIQSKWHGNGRGSIDLRDCTRFLKGVQALIVDDYSGFDEKIKRRASEIRSVLMRPDVRIVLVIAYSGADPLGADIEKTITQYLETQNNVGDTEVFSLECFDLGRLYSQLSGSSGRNIKLQIALTEWATVESPFRAYYGQVQISDIALWADYGKALLDRNLRFYRGATDVNEAIEESIRNTPDRFWYLNNGITVLCSSIAKAPIHGDARDIGLFECQGVSVVNGAQTLGVIWEAAKRSQDIGKSQAKVHVRLISLENCPEGFDQTVTKATNTQNRIEQRDFAALDALQQRLAREMALDGRRYAFKSGDPDARNGEGCSIEEAAVALACANRDPTLAVSAKREISTLWRDITKPPYTTLFNERISARDVWRAVIVLRSVEAELESVDKSSQSRGDLIAVHGNRFILHHVFQDPEIKPFRDPSLSESELRAKAIAITDRVFVETCAAVQAK
jgi:AIPR protein